jgi:hypothetical protein
MSCYQHSLRLLLLVIFMAWHMAAATSAYANDPRILFGTASSANAVSSSRVSAATLDTNKFVFCWAEAAIGNCRVATVSGTTITWGAVAQFSTDAVVAESQVSVCKIDTDKFAVAYSDDSLSEVGYTRAASVATRTISFGAAVAFSGTNDADSTGCAGIDTNKYIIGYNDEGNSNTGTGVACTADTASPPGVTCGTINDYAATDYYSLYNRPAKLDTDKFVMPFRSADTGTTPGAYVVAGSTSGTNITWDTVVQITANDVDNTYACSPQDADRFVVVYHETTNTNGSAVAGTTSGTTITLGSIADFNPSSGDIGAPSCAFISANQFVINFPDASDALYYGKAKVCDVNWSTRDITCGNPRTYEASDVLDAIAADGGAVTVLDGYGTTHVKFMMGFVQTAGADDVRAIIGDIYRARIIRYE